jgi:hypothetical protein
MRMSLGHWWNHDDRKADLTSTKLGFDPAASPSKICGGQSGTGTDSSTSTSVFPVTSQPRRRDQSHVRAEGWGPVISISLDPLRSTTLPSDLQHTLTSNETSPCS